MILEQCVLNSFSVIGKEGSTADGKDFIARLWQDANTHFDQVAPLALRKADGTLAGIWGCMTDFSRSFLLWEDGLTRGLYLAGVQVPQNAAVPPGWSKWNVPGFTCVRAQVNGDMSDVIAKTLTQLSAQGLALCGAIQEFQVPEENRLYLYFPIARLPR